MINQCNGRDGIALSLRDLTKTYGSVQALNRASLDVAEGEFVTLLGPSGSGKTTTLRIVAGFTTLDAGEVVLFGRSLRGVPPYRRDIGMVFQNYALFPHMTAGENIAFPLEMRGVPKREARKRVEEALALVGLPGLGNRYPRQLSGGQQQRVALARAVVFKPRLLLMDEPLGALDKKLREKMQLEIMRISRELGGVTILYVTHDQEEALVMSDRIAIFNRGQIEQVGTALQIYEHPTSIFVADFIGDSNIFRGHLEMRGSDTCVLVQGTAWRVPGPEPKRFQHGDAVALLVRPECVRIAPESETPASTANMALGVVREVIYLGSLRKHVVGLPGGVSVTSCSQVGQDRRQFPPGTGVRLSWNAEDSILIPDDS